MNKLYAEAVLAHGKGAAKAAVNAAKAKAKRAKQKAQSSCAIL